MGISTILLRKKFQIFEAQSNKKEKTRCVSVFQSMLDKPVVRLVMHVGSSTAWNMASSPMVKCPVTKPLDMVMIPSTLSSVKLEQENMYPELCSWISNLL